MFALHGFLYYWLDIFNLGNDLGDNLQSDEENLQKQQKSSKSKKKKSTIDKSKDHEYNCDRCDYSTNRADCFQDHITGGLKFKKCPWCDHHSKV